MHDDPDHRQDPQDRPLIRREPGPRGWGRTTGGAMLWALAGAVAAWWGTTILVAILREELDLAVPRWVRSWAPLIMFVVVLVVLAFLLVRRMQRLDTRPAPLGATDERATAAPSYRAAIGTVGTSLAVGLVGALVGGLVAAGACILVVLGLMAVVAPEAVWYFFFVPVAALVGALIGMAVAMGRRR